MNNDKWIATAFSCGTIVLGLIIAYSHHMDPEGAGMFLFGTLFGAALSMTIATITAARG